MLKNMCVLVVYVLIGCGALSSCGTKGPLYIPEQRYPQGAENGGNSDAAKKEALAANIDAPSSPTQ